MVELRHAELRIHDSDRQTRITASVAEIGQQVPVVVVAEAGSDRFVLIDGYLRVGALERLKRHRWPGNVRELENLARRLAALYPQETISETVIEAELAQPTTLSPAREAGAEETLAGSVERHLAAYFSGFDKRLPPPGLYHRILREVEYPLLSAALAATRGNQIRAADLLGVNRNTLRKKIRDLDIQVFRTSG